MEGQTARNSGLQALQYNPQLSLKQKILAVFLQCIMSLRTCFPGPVHTAKYVLCPQTVTTGSKLNSW